MLISRLNGYSTQYTQRPVYFLGPNLNYFSPGYEDIDDYGRKPEDPGYSLPLGDPLYYQQGYPGYNKKDEYGRSPDDTGYGQPGNPGYYTRDQTNFLDDAIGRTNTEPGYGQFGPYKLQDQRKKT